MRATYTDLANGQIPGRANQNFDILIF